MWPVDRQLRQRSLGSAGGPELGSGLSELSQEIKGRQHVAEAVLVTPLQSDGAGCAGQMITWRGELNGVWSSHGQKKRERLEVCAADEFRVGRTGSVGPLSPGRTN